MVGQTISHYKVLRKLGGGGMGVVYAAEDLHLHRQVALKFLSPRLAGAPHALARFQREALAASSCNHPHICTIHDIDRHEDTPFIVMELIDGVSLREELSRAPLPLPRLVRLAIEIADALETAHAAGIIHRDLTPTNIFVTKRGDAKVLDFGIAKLFAEQWSEMGTDASTETADSPLTGRGHVLGTPGYASPEQTLGLAVDARTDIFSLGVILYQMATGRRPFDGHTPGLVSDAVVHVTPIPAFQLNANVPAQLAAVIEKALEKDPALRYQTAADMKADLRRVERGLDPRLLDEAARQPGTGGTPAPTARGTTPQPGALEETATASSPLGSWRGRLVLAGAVGVAVLGTWLAIDRLWIGHALPETISRSVTSGPGNDTDPAVSPDGTRIAYVAQSDDSQSIWMADTQGGGRPWKAGPGQYRQPTWSPDGRLIFFESDANGVAGIYQAESLNPDATTFVVPNAGRPAVSPDGSLLAFVRRGGANNELRIATAPLADIRAVVMVSRDGVGRWDHVNPAWSPDSREICYQAWDGLWVVPAAGGTARQLTRSDSTDVQPVWSRSGYIYFSSKRAGLWQLWRVPAAGGTPLPVTVGLGTERAPTLSADGRLLAYSTATDSFDVVIHDMQTGTERLLGGGDQQVLPTFSADGQAVFFNMTSGSRQSIWRQPLQDGVPSGPVQALLPAASAGALASKVSQPACSPDGSRIAFLRLEQVKEAARGRGGWLSSVANFLGLAKPDATGERWTRSIWTVASAGGMPVPFTSSRDVDEYQPAWSPDGTRLAFVREHEGAQQVWIQGVQNGEPHGPATRLTRQSAPEIAPAWSPDGRQIAFIRADAGEVAIAPADGGSPPRVVTAGAGALSLRWRRPDVLLVSGHWGSGDVWLRAIDAATGRQAAEFAPLDLDRDPVSAVIDITPDGRYLALARSSGRNGRIGVLEAKSGRF